MDRVDAYQREHRWLGMPLGIVYKFFDDQGGYLAAVITYYAFVAIFPLIAIPLVPVRGEHPQNAA